MKKQYIQPDALFIKVISEDIILASLEDEEDVYVDGGDLFG